MPGSWKIHVDQVYGLHKPEFRFGDNLANTKLFRGKLPPSQSKTESSLGEFMIEFVVGDIAKTSDLFDLHGEYGSAHNEVNQVIVMPVPESGQSLVVRVWRWHHLQANSLIGEAKMRSIDKFGVPLEIGLLRHGKGKTKGSVRLSVERLEIAHNHTVGDEDDVKRHDYLDDVMELGNKAADVGHALAKEVLPESLAAAFDKATGTRVQRKLRSRPEDAPCIGEVTLRIKKIEALTEKVQKAELIVNVEDQEYQIHHLARKTEHELTFNFKFGHIESDLRIYCYDLHGFDRNEVVGRILIPLQEFLWKAGTPMTGTALLQMLRPMKPMSKTFTAYFMPPSKLGDGHHEENQFIDRFRPVASGVKRSGLRKSRLFGKVELQVDVLFYPAVGSYYGPLRNIPLAVYAQEFFSKLQALPSMSVEEESPDVRKSVVEEDDDEKLGYLDLIEYLKKVPKNEIMRNITQIQVFIADLVSFEKNSFCLWITHKRWRGPTLATMWLVFCLRGYFPPPLWLVPLYAWILVVLGCMQEAQTRAEEWDDLSSPAYHVWQHEEILMEVKTSTSDTVGGIINTIELITHAIDVFSSLIERIWNLFAFGDGNASVLWFSAWLVVACASSGILYLIVLFDPQLSAVSGIIGFLYLLWLSQSGWMPANRTGKFEDSQKAAIVRSQTPKVKKKDPFASVEDLNYLFDSVPDEADLAHRYIATRIQCEESLTRATLDITIVEAQGLRNADAGPGGLRAKFLKDLSDPYCKCEVSGKDNCGFQTRRLDDTLNPRWNEKHHIRDFVQGETLAFYVYDYDAATAHDFLGKAWLQSKKFFPHGFDGWLSMVDTGLKPGAAKLKVKVEVHIETRDETK